MQTVRSSRLRPTSIFLYIDHGGIGLDSQLQSGVDEMLGALKSKGYAKGKDFLFIHDPTAKHSEADWAKRLPSALVTVLRR